jgi:hypothetical protein
MFVKEFKYLIILPGFISLHFAFCYPLHNGLYDSSSCDMCIVDGHVCVKRVQLELPNLAFLVF